MLSKERTKRLVLAAVFCALTFLGTYLAIPSPVGGNLNFGDGVLLICAWTLGLPWGLGAAVGAALCDLIGYAVYCPATLVIKCLMVVAAVLIRKLLSSGGRHRLIGKILSALCAETIMVAGYYLFESVFVLNSFVAALANIPFNLLQALFAILIACFVTIKEDKWKNYITKT